MQRSRKLNRRHPGPKPGLVHLLFAVAVLAGFPPGSTLHADLAGSGRASVVKIFTSYQRANYTLPWQARNPSKGSGSGFVISGNRILTNAHLVADARFIQVQREGDSRQFQASVHFIAHDADLAMLKVDDEAFFKETRPLPFAEALPDLNEDVLVLGYPLGGNRLSVTKGIVSRLDHSTYSHSGIDHHLVLQVDAAINPGNSGGPVMYDGRVVGLAFQGLAWADNIGFAIPLPVINHFLDDIRDGTYHGYPELGAAYVKTQNPALRKDLGLGPDHTGVVLSYIDPYGAARGRLEPGDVLIDINNLDISNDGDIDLGGSRFPFTELIERMQWGDEVRFGIWRKGRPHKIRLSLDNPPDPFVFRKQYDDPPEYLVRGGLVFSPMSSEYLKSLKRKSSDRRIQYLFYAYDYAKRDGLHLGRDGFIVLINRLPHPVNSYAESFVNGLVSTVNGVRIRDLQSLKAALDSPRDGYHRIAFDNVRDILVLDAGQMAAAEAKILGEYHIAEPENIRP